MIQRKQSLYLLISAIILLLTGMTPFFTFDADTLTTMTGWAFENAHNEVVTRPWGVALFFLLGAVLAIFAIFRYKDRKRQLFLVNYQILLIFVGYVAIIAYGLAFASHYQAEMTWEAGLIVPLIAGTFSFLAHRGIRHDEELVKAADRIR